MAAEFILGELDGGERIVSLQLAKQNSKIDFEEEDDLLDLFLQAAGSEIENYIGTPILIRPGTTYETGEWFKSWNPTERISSIEEVSYRNDLDEAVVLPPEDYFLNKSTNTFVLKNGKPEDFVSSLKITCFIGYTSEEMPADIKRAALLIFSNADTYRENMPVKLNTAAQTLLRPYKLY